MTELSTDQPHPWQQLAEHVWTLQTDGLRMNVGLVVGTERALVIDTGTGPLQAAWILDAVRQMTDRPITAVNTHAHYDHVFGNAYLAAHGVEDFWAAERCAAVVIEHGDKWRAAVAALEPAMASNDGDHTNLHPANKLVTDAPVDLDLGGVSVTLFHLGRGHTDHDLLVGAGNVLFTGDLVEEGADPAFDDSFPSDWIRTLGKVAALDDLYDVFVPGHGSPVSVDFVTTQLNKMRSAVRVTKIAMDEASVDMTKAIPILPYGPEQSRVLLTRLRTLAHWKWLERQSS
ncbi:glyoxylase-like metal-dependent hydrolase (beta-lactamase superfamily II) [Arthrobacter pigmenti]|uniref:Glyoxylase-like metal-dependent hydrolase (Beta-lactamase superfamily II) n=1 Tax=Arthrobacter pigmenti TaxID=271432 RepID=A0A846RJD0_9MICC|nr:MBL fold metallo-hydrolase [Arthrobacter pigmenti]NJC23343.1 glyoxylase-like metal-dependent hydrolase (beta-lactamase superfamily II) [Arthrobacter pigmenti]